MEKIVGSALELSAKRFFSLDKYCLKIWVENSAFAKSLFRSAPSGVLVYLVPMVSCPQGHFTLWYLVAGNTLPQGRMSHPVNVLVLFLGANCIQHFQLGKYIVRYTVGNLVLRPSASGAWKVISDLISNHIPPQMKI